MSKSSEDRAPFAIPAPVQGALWMVAASTCWALMSALIRHIAVDLHPFEIAFFRTFFAALIAAPHMIRARTGLFPRAHHGLYLFRAGVHEGAMLSWFFALTMIPLMDATALYFTAPFFATLLAVFVLREKVSGSRWAAVAVGFAGAMLVAKPGATGMDWNGAVGSMAVLMTALCSALGRVTVRSLTRLDSPNTIVAHNFVILTPLVLFAAVWFWEWPTIEQLVLLGALGTLGAVGHLFLTRAYAVAEASEVAPFDFTQLLAAGLIGYFVFAEIPDNWTLAGSALIAAAGIYIALREAYLRRSTRAVARRMAA
ncbi:MAG: DMT family transporter [Alphaproteobacteria bacterium]